MSCGIPESIYAYPFRDVRDGNYKIADVAADGTLSIFTFGSGLTANPSVASVDTSLGYSYAEGYAPSASIYRNFQVSTLFVLSDYDFISSNGEVVTVNNLSDVPISE